MLDRRSYRHRRSGAGASDRARSIGRRWARLRRRIPEGMLEILAFGLALTAGMTELSRGGTSHIAPGAAVALVGLVGLCWQGWLLRRRALDAHIRRETSRIRARQRGVRRARNSQEREERQKRIARDTAARERAREIRDAQRLTKIEMAAAADERRRAHEEALSLEATRLLALDSASFKEAVREAFEARGFKAAQAEGEGDCDLLLCGPDGDVRALARLAPHKRAADAKDVSALEAWRRDVGAPGAFLIGTGGFAPGAVRLASAFPVTLTDAHLLAQWRLGSRVEPLERRAY